MMMILESIIIDSRIINILMKKKVYIGKVVASPSYCPRCRTIHCGLNLRDKGPNTTVYICCRCNYEWKIIYRDNYFTYDTNDIMFMQALQAQHDKISYLLPNKRIPDMDIF